MAVKSIIDIDVDDSKFKQFYDLFEKYRKALNDSPKSWAKADSAIGVAADSTKDLTAAIVAQTAVLSKQVDAYAKIRTHVREADQSMINFNRTAKKTFDLITGTTGSILKWGSIFAGGASILAGFGGFFGFESLARSQAGTLTSAMGLGVQPGQFQAANIAYQNIPGSGSILSALAAAQGTAQTYQIEGMLGLPPGSLAGKNAAEMFPIVARAMQKGLQSPAAGQYWQQYGKTLYGGFASDETLRALHGMTPGRLEEFLAEGAKPTGARTEAEEKFQDFIRMLERSKTELGNSLAGPLSQLAKPLGNVVTAFGNLARTIFESPEFNKGVNEFASWIERLSKDIQTPEFRDSVQTFVSEVGKVIVGLGRLAKWLASWFGDKETSLPGGQPYDVGPGGKPGEKQYNLPQPYDPSGIPSLPGQVPIPGTRDDNIFRVMPGSYRTGAGKFGAIEARYGVPSGILQAIENLETGGGKGSMLSGAGAMGYFQFMPKTAQQYGLRNPWNEMESADAAARFFMDLYGEFHDTQKALAAYNAGPQRVRDAIAKASRFGGYWENYLPQETVGYLRKYQSMTGTASSMSVNTGQMVSLNINNSTGGVLTASSNNLATQYAYSMIGAPA